MLRCGTVDIFILKVIEEIRVLTGHKIKPFAIEMLAAISKTFQVDLNDGVEFYKKLGSKLGDFGNLIEVKKNTICSKISIECGNLITVFVGIKSFSVEEDIHLAIWRTILLHIIFKVKFGEEISNLAQAVAHFAGWDFIPVSERVKFLCTSEN